MHDVRETGAGQIGVRDQQRFFGVVDFHGELFLTAKIQPCRSRDVNRDGHNFSVREEAGCGWKWVLKKIKGSVIYTDIV
jgi:hypothetical protein